MSKKKRAAGLDPFSPAGELAYINRDLDFLGVWRSDAGGEFRASMRVREMLHALRSAGFEFVVTRGEFSDGDRLRLARVTASLNGASIARDIMPDVVVDSALTGEGVGG